MNCTVGISEMRIATNPAEVLVTYSLGSCVGLTLYDPSVRVGGMVHCMLPSSRIDPAKAAVRPCMFTDTGVVSLLQEMFDLGAEPGNIVAKVAGGATLIDTKGVFRIGDRNYAALCTVLWQNDILIAGEDVGGTVARTLHLYMATGVTTVKAAGREYEL